MQKYYNLHALASFENTDYPSHLWLRICSHYGVSGLDKKKFGATDIDRAITK